MIRSRALSTAVLLALSSLATSPASAQSFGPRIDLDTGPAPRSLAIGDLNHSGHLDIAVAVQGANVVSIFLGYGNLTFGDRIDVAVPPGPVALALVDWNGDSHLDLLVGAAGDSSLSVHVGNGAGGFVPGAWVKCPSVPYEIETADFDGDGRLDAAIAADDPVAPLFDVAGTFAGGFGPPRVLLGPPHGRSRDIAIAQLDSLSGPDIYFTSIESGSVVLFNDGAGNFPTSQSVPLAGPAFGVAVGEVDGNHGPDVVETYHGDAGIIRLLRGGFPSFVPRQYLPVGAFPRAPALADMNLDGRTDVVFLQESGSQLAVSMQGCALLAPGSTDLEGIGVDLAVGDFDEDGEVDYVVADSLGASVAVVRNNDGWARCAPLAVATPAEIDFGPGPLGQVDDVPLRIDNEGEEPLLLLGASPLTPAFGHGPIPGAAIAPGGHTYIVVRTLRPALGDHADTLVIQTNGVDVPEVRVPLSATVVRPPILQLDPATVAPVELALGETETVPLSLLNLGDEWPLEGSLEVTVDSSELTLPALPVVSPIQLRFDGAGHLWDLQADGSVANGDSAAFAGGVDWLGFPAQESATLRDGGRTIQLGPTIVATREFTRSIHVPLDGAWIRYVDTVRNLGNLPITYRMQVRTTKFPSLSGIPQTSSGDGLLQPADNWAVVADESGPVLAFVLAGAGAQRPAFTAFGPGLQTVNYDYSLELAPGETASILHYALQAPSLATAAARAESLSAPGTAALDGVGALERSRIVNFVLPQAISTPIGSFSVPILGSQGFVVKFDADATADESTVYGSLRIRSNDPLQPLVIVPLELRVLGVPDVVDAPPTSLPLALTARFAPNPAVGRALRLTYALPAEGDARFELYDARGRRLAARHLSGAPAGRGTLDWSGDADVALAPGVYWTRLTHGGRTVITKGVVLN